MNTDATTPEPNTGTRLLAPGLLPRLSGIEVPHYDRSAVRAGIVHIGVGGFHRAHQAMYLDRLMNQGQALDWGICGMGVLPSDERMRDALDRSSGLYTLLVKHPDGTIEPRVIGSIVDFVYAPSDPGAAVEKLADPAIRIVSLTITEGGYNIHHVTGAFELRDPAVAADLAGGEGASTPPSTVFGLVCRALQLRRDRGVAPFTVMSCDNIQGNGEVAHRAFTAFARAMDSEFADWMEREVPFPNSMVDRITPATTDKDRAEVRDRYGIDDAWPVVSEDFTQWVLEDSFADGRPPFEDVGVEVVSDVEPYELMKLRLLNASHQALCYFGYLAGYRAVHDVARDPAFADMLRRYWNDEAIPTLTTIPGVDFEAYCDRLLTRYGNEYVADTVARLCAESSDRIPKWLLPVVRENLAAGRPVPVSAGVVASWARYAEGVDEEGRPITILDRMADELTQIAAGNREDPDSFIRNREIFGDLAQEAAFREPYEATLRSLHQRGSSATVQKLANVSIRP